MSSVLERIVLTLPSTNYDALQIIFILSFIHLVFCLKVTSRAFAFALQQQLNQKHGLPKRTSEETQG